MFKIGDSVYISKFDMEGRLGVLEKISPFLRKLTCDTNCSSYIGQHGAVHRILPFDMYLVNITGLDVLVLRSEIAPIVSEKFREWV